MKANTLILSFCLIAGAALTAGAADPVRERIYVRTDKQTYLPGEMLWLKAHVTGHDGRPVSFSRIGYVELHDGSSPVVQVKIELSDGNGSGWMELPATLPTGYYYLRAYTRYMRNEGEAVFFSKRLAVINPFTADRAISIDTAPPALPLPRPEPGIKVSLNRGQACAIRSEGEILLEDLPEDIHSLSLSVAGKDIVPGDGLSDICSWHGQLPQLPLQPVQAGFIPEYEGHIVAGSLTDAASGEPADERVVSFLAFPGDRIRLFGGQYRDEGRVSFYTKGITGVYMAAAVTRTGPSGREYRLGLQSPFAPLTAVARTPFRLHPSWESELLQRSVALQVMHSYTPDMTGRTDSASIASVFMWPPDRTYILDEYTRFTSMEEVVSEFVLGLGIRRDNGKRYISVMREDRIGQTLAGSSVNSLVLLDGIPIADHDFICNYDPLQVRKIEIYRGVYFFGEQYFDGIASFSTYNYRYPGLKTDAKLQMVYYEGTQPQRLFRYPSYRDEQERKSPAPDFRHTLLWMPEISTGGRSSVVIPFTTSDYTGEFQVVVEGLTRDGKPVFGIADFKVE
ncbi:MAG: hypothetical protein LBK65_09495 [Tannerellaceae bacterium]|jgi:hypothetical protein|nr:hypothetical protein [Tannerellaceae bacterium]